MKIKMKYRGKGFHNIEELEVIIDNIFEEKYENRQNEESDKIMLGKLSELIKELHFSLNDEINNKDSVLTKGDIMKNLKIYIEDFSKDNNFRL